MKKWILLFIILFLTGCDFKEIRDLSITSTMGIDFTGDTYQVSVIVIDKKEGESKLYKGEGNSFLKAIQGVNDKLTERLYLGHIQNVIVSEAVSKEGLSDIFNYFLKEDVMQNNFYLFLVRDSTSFDVLSYLMENGGYTLSNIFKENNMLRFKKNTNSIRVFISDMMDKGKDPVLHSFSFQEGILSSPSLALFQKDRLKGFTDMVGYYLLNGNIEQIYLSLPCKEMETTFSIDHMKFRSKYHKNQLRHFISGNVVLKENGCNLSTRTNDDIQKIKKEIEKVMIQKINTFLRDQEKAGVHAFSYPSFFTHKGYEQIDISVSLSTDDLEDKGDFHE